MADSPIVMSTIPVQGIAHQNLVHATVPMTLSQSGGLLFGQEKIARANQLCAGEMTNSKLPATISEIRSTWCFIPPILPRIKKAAIREGCT